MITSEIQPYSLCQTDEMLKFIEKNSSKFLRSPWIHRAIEDMLFISGFSKDMNEMTYNQFKDIVRVIYYKMIYNDTKHKDVPEPISNMIFNKEKPLRAGLLEDNYWSEYYHIRKPLPVFGTPNWTYYRPSYAKKETKRTRKSGVKHKED